MPVVGPAAEQRVRVPGIAPGGGCAAQLEKNPILHILHLREPEPKVIHTAPEHYINLTCWYLRQPERYMEKVMKCANHALEVADEDMQYDPIKCLLTAVKARLLNCIVYSRVKQDHERAFLFVFEANGILDAFWEERQDQVLNKRFWYDFADQKGRVLKALAFEAEFLCLPGEMRTELWKQYDLFFSQNGMLMEPELPQDIENPVMIGNQLEPSWRRPNAINLEEGEGSSPHSSFAASAQSDSRQQRRIEAQKAIAERAQTQTESQNKSPKKGQEAIHNGQHQGSDSDANDPAKICSRALKKYEKMMERERRKEMMMIEASKNLQNKSVGLSTASFALGSMELGKMDNLNQKPEEEKVQGLVPGERQEFVKDFREWFHLTPEQIAHARSQWMIEIKVKQSAGKKVAELRAEKTSQQANTGVGNNLNLTQTSKDAGAPGVVSKARNCFEEFQNHDAQTSKKTKFSGKLKALQAADTRNDYRKWKWGMKSNIRKCRRDAMEFPETLFEKKVLFSQEGMASQKRRKRLPGMRTQDQNVQRGLLVGGVKMNIVNLKLVMGHHYRLMKFGLDDETTRKRALAELRVEMGEDMNKVKKVYKLAESLYDKFHEAARLRSVFKRGKKRRTDQNRKTMMRASVRDGQGAADNGDYDATGRFDDSDDMDDSLDDDDDEEEQLRKKKNEEEKKQSKFSKEKPENEGATGELLNFVKAGFGSRLAAGTESAQLQKKIQLSASEMASRNAEEKAQREEAERKKKEEEVKDSSSKFFNRGKITDQATNLAQQADIRGMRSSIGTG